MIRTPRVPTAIVAFALLTLGAGGCAVNPATGERTFTGGMTHQDEVEMGRKLHPQVLAEMGGEYAGKDLARYVNIIGQVLARTGERNEIKYTFTVINSDIVNAFAIPGGYIYVSRGLLALADDEAELAGVLAHELGHITALHHARRHGQSLVANVTLLAAGLLAGTVAPGTEKSIMGLGQQAAIGVLRSFSREDEYQADDLGIRYLSRSGYDPQGMARFLAKLRAHSRLEAVLEGRSPDAVNQFNYLATHPAPKARVTRATANARKISIKQPITARENYLKQIDGIIYGGSPEQGFVRGRNFFHPELRFRFSVPVGYTLRNSPTTVTARGPGNSMIVFDMARNAGWRNTYFYLTSVWAKDAQLQHVRNITVNGLKGTEGVTRTNTRHGVIDVWLVAVRGHRNQVYRFMFLSPQGQTARARLGFEETISSLRQISSADADSVKPRRLKIVRVRKGDTQASLARRMVFSRRALDRFRVLNGLGPGDRLRPGQPVKIITE